MSFWPNVARAILRDSMPLEFRKRRNGCEEGAQVLVYASKEVGGVVGSYTVGKVVPYENLDELEAKLNAMGYDIQRPNLDKYLVGVESGFAHEVIDPQVIETPLKLGVAEDGKKIKGPQSFQYIDPENPEHVRLVESLESIRSPESLRSPDGLQDADSPQGTGAENLGTTGSPASAGSPGSSYTAA